MLNLNPNTRYALIIDSHYLYSAVNALHNRQDGNLYEEGKYRMKVDYVKFMDYLEKQDFQIVRGVVYIVDPRPDIPAMDDEEEKNFDERFGNFCKTLKKLNLDISRHSPYHDGIDKPADYTVDIGVNTLAIADKVDGIILVTGERRLIPLLRTLNNRGIRTILIAFRRWMNKEIRQFATQFINLDKVDILTDEHELANLQK